MRHGHGNQHHSPKKELMGLLRAARFELNYGNWQAARRFLGQWKARMRFVPRSTRRRWKCGK